MNKKQNIGKRIFSVLLSFVLFCSVLSDSILVLAEEERVIYISSTEDLLQAAKQCRLDTYSQGKRFELTEDLNLSEENFEGFATFGGTFQGNGHMISGIHIEYQGSNQGFFRYIQEGGKIENLSLVGSATFSGSSSNVGMLAGVNQGTIRGCSVTVSASGKTAIGGIAGVNEGSGIIDRCIVRGSLAGEHYTGGIAGKNLGVITRCTNYASINTTVEEIALGLDELNLEQLNSTENVSVNTDTGGIAGFSSGSITESTNRGKIGYPHVGYNIGGIVGRQSGYIENCYNYGTIHGRKDVAGIVGQMEPYLLLQYTEDVVQKLRTAFDQLDSAMYGLMDDLDLSSDNLRGHFDQVLDLLDAIQTDFTDLSNQTADYANDLSDSANDITERIDLALNRTHTVLDSMQSASDFLTEALEEMEHAVENIDDTSDDGRIVVSYLQNAMEELSSASAHLSTAIKDARNVQEILRKKLKTEVSTPSKPEETESEETTAEEITTSETIDEVPTSEDQTQESTAETTSQEDIPETESVSESVIPSIGGSEVESVTLPNQEELESISKELETITLPNQDELESVSKELETITLPNQDELESVSKELETITLPNQDELESVSKELESITLPSKDELESISKELESATITSNDIRAFLLRYFTEEELKNLEANLTGMGDQLQYASNALNRAFDEIEDMRPYLRSMADSEDAAEQNIADALNNMKHASTSLSDAFEKADYIIDALEGNHAVSFPKLDEGYRSLMDSISDLCGRVLDVLKMLNSDANSNSSRITDDIRTIQSCISNVEDILLDALEGQQEKGEEETDENGSRIFEEATYEETEHILQGKLKSSINYGTVEADIAVGGIIGNMAIEYDLDPEEDIHIQGDISLNFQYKTSTVLSDSINYGTITAKKDYVGGMIGKMDLGTARNCQSYGTISSEGGKYIGGIAGSSRALIENSYARCKLIGNQYVGGIAGSAYDLNHCYALIQIEEAAEFYGAIAGETAKNGELYENYFVIGDWDGIDRISYSKMAMPVEYQEMIAAEGFPKEFTEFLLTFVAEDQIVAEIPFHYGDTLSADAIPAVPEKEGYYANWETFDSKEMKFNKIIHAVYTKEKTVISSETKTENGKTAVLLLEGTFDEQAEVTIRDIKESTKIELKERETLLSGWHIEVNNPHQEQKVYTAHIIKPKETDSIRLRKKIDGNWTEITYTESGSYLVFEMDGNTADICFVGADYNREMFLCILGGILLVGGVGILIRMWRKKKKKQKKNSSDKTKEGKDSRKAG